jgi:hypothetical protein
MRAARRKRDPKHRAKMARKRANRDERSKRSVTRAQAVAESERRLTDMGIDVRPRRRRR